VSKPLSCNRGIKNNTGTLLINGGQFENCKTWRFFFLNIQETLLSIIYQLTLTYKFILYSSLLLTFNVYVCEKQFTAKYIELWLGKVLHRKI